MYLTKLVVLQINTKYRQNEKMDVEVKIGQSKMWEEWAKVQGWQYTRMVTISCTKWKFT